jgi:hypothetical protein
MSFFTTLNLFNLSVNPKNSVILVARSKRKGVLKKDQIRFMEILAKSVADRDPSLVKEILLILIIASLALRISERGRGLPDGF